MLEPRLEICHLSLQLKMAVRTESVKGIKAPQYDEAQGVIKQGLDTWRRGVVNETRVRYLSV